MNTLTSPLPTGRSLSRDTFVALLNKALLMENARFVRQAALSWLAAFPGDLEVNYLYARALVKEGQAGLAAPILNRLTQTDPEWLDAAQLRLESELLLRNQQKSTKQKNHHSHQAARLASTAELIGCVLALGGVHESKQSAPHSKDAAATTWSQQVRQARQALESYHKGAGDNSSALSQADILLNPALAADTSTALIAATQMRILRAGEAEAQTLRNLGEFYHRRWPDCVLFQLLLAEALIVSGETEQAVAFLHRAAANDTAAQVARRLWGESFPYRNLWPQRMEISLEVPVPAQLAAAMGWNQLPEGPSLTTPGSSIPETSATDRQKGIAGFDFPTAKSEPLPTGAPTSAPISQPVDPETLVSIQQELERVAERLSLPGLARNDGRYPVYVVLTTRRGLEKHYGQAAASEIDAAMRSLVETIKQRREWNALLYYADEGIAQMAKPARFNDPWAIKLALADLDKALTHKGEMIGALLIVGGPEIVPFHHLPNPVDDVDDDVPSDNPYGTRDENYFIPEWPVGRLPGGKSSESAYLVQTLQRLVTNHATRAKNAAARPWYQSLWRTLLNLLRWSGNRNATSLRKASSFGYTAAIWKRASTLVFRPIGEARALRISPPHGSTNTAATSLPSARLGYFNLHGLADAVEWYGQSDPAENSGNTGAPGDYPIAVRPQDILNSGHAPEVIFSEACYGANIVNKGVEEALAMKFLQAGSQAVVGSTCTSYGSINTPLTAADLLGQGFWEALRQGAPAGEALRRAKLTLAREMHRRQSYLDGEDQKTLVSFVLYGDPLSQPLGLKVESKAMFRSIKPPKGIRTVCDRSRPQEEGSPVSEEINEYVKKIVAQYLPGMQDARMHVSHEHGECETNGHNCPTKQLHRHARPHTAVPSPARSVVVLSKQVAGSNHMHHHYARLTLDEGNHLVKIVVSR